MLIFHHCIGQNVRWREVIIILGDAHQLTSNNILRHLLKNQVLHKCSSSQTTPEQIFSMTITSMKSVVIFFNIKKVFGYLKHR